MSNADNIVKKLLETPTLDWQSWPEFKDVPEDDISDYLLDCPEVYLRDFGGWYAIDIDNNFALSLQPANHSYRLDYGKMTELLHSIQAGASSFRMDDGDELEGHGPLGGIPTRYQGQGQPGARPEWPKWEPEPEPQEYSLEQKSAHKVYESGDYIFLKLPTDVDFIRREGKDMSHCLNGSHHSYSQRMAAGQIEVYSMTDKRDNKPRVDIEVALTRGSYSSEKVSEPVVTQIRGIRNECPPKDEYLPALMDFLTNYGKGWKLTGHRVQNFDGTLDGQRVLNRWNQLQSSVGGS